MVENLPSGAKREPEATDIARVDTAHGAIHADRLYRRDEPTDFDVDVDDVWDAAHYLTERWKRYVEEYRKTHGL